MATTTLPTRDQLDPRFTWNIESLYPDEQAYRDEFEIAERDIEKLRSYRGRLGESSATLADFMDEYWRMVARIQKLGLYANLPVSVDQGNQEARGRAGRFQGLAVRWSTAVAFVQPELLEIGHDRLQEFMRQEQRLGYLERYFEKLEKNRAHVRSQEVEDILGRLNDPFGAIERAYNSLANGEIEFAPVTTEDGPNKGQVYEVGRSSYPRLRMSTDRELRRKAYASYSDGFLSYRNTFTDLYLGRVKQSVFWSRVRGYESTVEEQLEPREVPRAVLDAVVETFRKNIGVWHRYWAARRKILGVDRHEEWDIFAPLSPNPPTVPYRQAIDWIVEGMKPLGEEYVEPMRRGLLEERWTDVYPNRGKRDGAFAARAYESQPFIMMSYHDDLESVSTLAHELGHAVHGVLLGEAQPLPYANYSMMMAETASNFNQALVRGYLLEQLSDEDSRLAVLDEAFYNFHRYFFIMPTLVRFELAVHEAVERGEGLTANRLGEIMQGLFQEGYGDEIATSERTGITWAQFGHLYVPFYTFQYAAGIAAAAALAEDVRSGRPGAVERYLTFLRAGSSVPPVDALRAAGVDMTTAAPIERAFGQLEGYVAQLEELAAKR
ncbi:MAG TPA: oligoendopeptidase F [Trueperaceae bacterium]